MKRVLLSSMIFLLPFFCLQAGISGSYTVSGCDPFTDQPYYGMVDIERDGDVYNALWSFYGGGHDIGTGFRKGDVISFAFQNVNHPEYVGIQQYKIHGDLLEGPWALIGSDKVGRETIIKVNGSSSSCISSSSWSSWDSSSDCSNSSDSSRSSGSSNNSSVSSWSWDWSSSCSDSSSSSSSSCSDSSSSSSSSSR